MADYFRAQSNGLFNIQFDIIGPVKLTTNQKSKAKENQGWLQINEALKAVDPEVDFSVYDWDGQGRVQAVILIYAGYGGNEDTKARAISQMGASGLIRIFIMRLLMASC